ncbi:MAG: hypothetical protein ACNS61_12905 [Candidatus Wenzhouxiangella sp. M2_3B_020]
MLRRNNTPEIRELLRDEPARLVEMAVDGRHWRLDVARIPQPLEEWRSGCTSDSLSALENAVARLFAGEIVNPSERQPALHMALRATDPQRFADSREAAMVRESRERLLEIARRLHSGSTGIRTVIHAGIGGSDLGPRLVADALDPGDGAVTIEWLTTLDARRMRRLLARLEPAETALVVASKSFSTVETLKQAAVVRDWLGSDGADRIWAATAKPERAADFGIAESNVLPFPEWTGGRYSLWSSVGLSAAARIGPARWETLLAGAEVADADVLAGLSGTPALALARSLDALVRGHGYASLGVVSYEPRLRLLAEYLQQLVMESLGKSAGPNGGAIGGPTSPLIFGGAGTDLQHSLFQALHQGTTRHPMLLLGCAEQLPGFEDWQREQLAHLLGQASVLVNGRRADSEERSLPGNNPVMVMLARELGPAALGELLVTFEHAVYLLGVLWNINPFDQWGVEEGKRIAGEFRNALEGHGQSPDDGLSGAIDWLAGRG